MGDISLVAQVVVFHNTRAFDQLVKKYQSPVRRFFLHQTCGDSELSDDLACSSSFGPLPENSVSDVSAYSSCSPASDNW